MLRDSTGTVHCTIQIPGPAKLAELYAGGDLYEDLRRRGGKYEEVVTAAGVMKPCIEALMYLHSKVSLQILST